MKPYYQDSHVTIYHGDCRELMTVGSSADCTITDPPYGETSLGWDRWADGWPAALLGACRRSLWCFGSLRMFMVHAEEFACWKHSQEIVWEKHNGSSFHADRFKRVHELAAFFYPPDSRWASVYHSPVYTNDATARTVRRKTRPPHTGHIEAGSYTSVDGGPRLMRSVISVRSCHGSAVHPTQKPVGIVSPLIEYSCPSSGVVFDPFMGSGTILRVAKDTGRRAIGIEADEFCCEVAAKRMIHEVLQDEDARAGQGECPGTACNSASPKAAQEVLELGL